MKGFASDNYSGVHPDILKAITEANFEHESAYGNDTHTEKAVNKFKEIFGDNIEVFFVYNGTGANVLSLKALTKSYSSVICADTSHIYVDESTAPESFTGCRLKPLKSEDGKITPDQIEKYCIRFGDEHHAQPTVVSITQATELGTVYTIDEIKAITSTAKKHGMYVHMDGARISNAAASLGCSFKDFTKDAGVDVLSFGGTKNGMMFGEAVIFFNTSLAKEFKYIRKHGMQLSSKMRYISAQFAALLSNDLWRKNAQHANNMAKLLKEKLKDIPEIKITQPVDANGIFAIVPKDKIPVLQERFPFYVWDENTSEVRWMMSFDTTEEEINNFVRLIKEVLQ